MVAAAAAPQATSSDTDFIRFPPFPPPPAGVKIILFKDFKEAGIKLFCPNGDGIEVDGADIPTVALEHKHATDQCKTNALRKKEEQDAIATKKRKAKASASSNTAPRKWWEIWQDEEAGKSAGPYSLKTPVMERLYRAATDFRTSRSWPQPEARKLGVDKLWDQFSAFIGLQAIIPAWIRAERIKEEKVAKAIRDTIDKASENANPAQNESDDDDDDVTDEDAPVIEREDAPEDANEENTLEDKDETAAIEEENIRKEDRVSAFLADSETVVKMFLSSYMRKEGLIWSDPNLFNAPRVLFFFFRFVLRNKLLPEHETGFKKALVVIERAQQELPATSVIAKIIPCEVGLALRDQFGSKAETFKYQIMQDIDDQENRKVEANAHVDNINDMLEETTVEYVGGGEYEDVTRPVDTGIARIEEVVEDNEDDNRSRKRAKIEDDSEAPEAPEVTMDVDSGNAADASNAGDTGAWGDAWNYETSWGDISANPEPVWSLPVYSLSKFLATDALPATHVTGVVEESVRRIISVHAPKETPTLAETLEGQLENKLGRIVLAPWNEWDVPTEGEGLNDIRRVYTEIYRGKRLEKGIRRLNLKEGEEEKQKTESKPKPEEYYDEDPGDTTESTAAKIIWENSRGWVVEPSSGDIVFSDCTSEKPAHIDLPDGCKVHDPHKNIIEAIVDPSIIDKLKDNVGIGVGGTFVQLVEEEKLRTGGKSTAKTFWYMEDLKLVVPSFYTS
ncbi:hypothetical protein APHAL10511_001546 [Amanita phalloides]|nr:hypothetical protein APHAL10511_001546 [Amanita phalloides]